MGKYGVTCASAAHGEGTKFYELILIMPWSDGTPNVSRAVCIQRNGPISAYSTPRSGQHRVLGVKDAASSAFYERLTKKQRDGYPLVPVASMHDSSTVRELLRTRGHRSLADAIADDEPCYEPPESRETVKQAEEIPRIIPHNYGGW